MVRQIKLMTEYNYFPLWDLETGENLYEEDLPLSIDLTIKLNNLADSYNKIIDWENPSNSSFKSEEEELQFYTRLFLLGCELQEELGDNYKVLVCIQL